jgi:hypothetical protein
MSEERSSVHCPNCDHELSVGLVAQCTKESRVAWKIYPKPGELMNAATVGGTLVDVGKLLKAVGKEQGLRVDILVESVTSNQEAITFNLLIARFEPGIRK